LKPSRAAESHYGPLAPTRYAAAAQALRKKDLQGSRQLLEKVARDTPDEGRSARLLSGLYSYTAHDLLHAEELLASSPTPGGKLEDWRLYLLGASASARGHDEAAQAAYSHLLATCPRSPLRGPSYLEAAELARHLGKNDLTLDLVASARREDIDGDIVARLENLAWEIGKERRDDSVLRAAGRRLLIEAPLSASSLSVHQSFRAVGDAASGETLLSAGEVKRRALSFLDSSQLPMAALTTLEALPEGERDAEWRLLEARALLATRRAEEALTVLSGTSGRNEAERASLEGIEAEAAAAAAVRLPRPARLERLTEAHEHLMAAVREGGAIALSAETVKRLYTQFQAAGLADLALDALRALRRVDPGDVTGAATLWEHGWNEYQTGDAPAAVASWSLLEEIYPESADTQRGLYWQARALERMGEKDRAQEIYRRLVAHSDTSDFYSRQAIAELGREPGPAWAGDRVRNAGSWRIDPLLERAKLLTDLGLDDLAKREMELVGKRAGARDLLALKALILGRGSDHQAESLILLREAFPALGTAYQASVPQEILRAYYPLEYGEEIRAYSAEQGVPAWLVAGVIRQESAFNPRATSHAGARGLMQLMPDTARETARRLGIPYRTEDLYDPQVSLRLGTAYLRELIDDFHGNWELALAGYNGGPNRISRLWQAGGPGARLDDFVENLGLDESRSYVKRILVLADSYRQLYPEAG
jgi:soluble lytic murein transglycosylase